MATQHRKTNTLASFIDNDYDSDETKHDTQNVESQQKIEIPAQPYPQTHSVTTVNGQFNASICTTLIGHDSNKFIEYIISNDNGKFVEQFDKLIKNHDNNDDIENTENSNTAR